MGDCSAFAPHRRNFGRPLWRGEPLGRKTILLYAEQGYGDTIQFVRYVPLVAALGARVILEVQGVLARLVAQSLAVDVVPYGQPLPVFDLQCPLMSLPLALGTGGSDTIPADIPYLQPAVTHRDDRESRSTATGRTRLEPATRCTRTILIDPCRSQFWRRCSTCRLNS